MTATGVGGPEGTAGTGVARPGHPASRFAVRKVFDDLPCCHRAWAQEGNCRFLHGYERSYTLDFVADRLEPGTDFVVDFSQLKAVRALLADQFDHTTLVARDDPALPRFRELADDGLIRLRVMDSTGMEGSAVWVLEHADALIRAQTGGRVRVARVEARESRKNAVVLTADGP